MNFNNSMKLPIMLALPIFSYVGVLPAQESKTVENTKRVIQEIVVTAQKREQSLKDVPMSIAAFTGEVLEERRIEDFSDLAAAVPSLSIPERGGAGGRFVFLRGMGSIQGSTPLVGIYLDEASVTSFPGAALDLRTYDLERVEVLRGPQGTLYGVGSMGGTIRFITRDPELDRFGGVADASASFTEGGDPSHVVRGTINLPLIENELGLRIAASYDNSGGWMDQPQVSKSNINDDELLNVRAKLLWAPSDELEIRATTIVHRGDSGAPSTGEDSDGNYTQAFFLPTTPSGSHDYELYNLTASYDFSSVNLLSTTSYVDMDRIQHQVGYRVPIGADANVANATLFHVLFDEDINAKMFTQELRLSSIHSDRLSWTIGTFYRDAEYAEAFDLYFGTPGFPFPIPISTLQSTESWAVFGEISYFLTDDLEVGAGIRYFEDDQTAKDLLAKTSDSVDFDAVSPRFFVTYSVNENMKVYANIGKGFRSGGLVGGVGVQAFEPDYVWSYDVGAKLTAFDGRLSADVSIFYSDYEDTQVDSVQFVNGNLSQFTANVGNAEIQGVDWELVLQATDNLSLGFGGEYIDTEFVEINALAASHAVGDPIDFIADYHYNLWTRYDFNWPDDFAEGYVRLDYSRQGESRYGNRTLCPCYESFSGTIDMFNAVIGWQRNAWSVELFAENIFNDRGYIDAESIEQISARARPRTVGLQVGVEF